MTATAGLRSRIAEKRYLSLLVVVLVMLVLSPLIPLGRPIGIALTVATFLAVFAALQAVWAHPRLKVVAVALGLGGWLLRTIGDPQHGLRVSGDLLGFLFLLLVLVSVLGDVLRARRVTADTVMGAACVYILMGVAWGYLFDIVEWLEPGSFVLSADALADSAVRSAQLTYFSFITLTTVGYGDITPLTPAARVFSMVEGLIGQLYIAILIARLVGLHTAAGTGPPSSD